MEGINEEFDAIPNSLLSLISLFLCLSNSSLFHSFSKSFVPFLFRIGIVNSYQHAHQYLFNKFQNSLISIYAKFCEKT